MEVSAEQSTYRLNLTPDRLDLLAIRASNPQRYPFLLESAAGDNSTTARYSLLLAFPGETIELNKCGLHENGKLLATSDFLEHLNQRYLQHRLETTAIAGSSPFNGGWFVYLAYELAGQIEPKLQLPMLTSDMPQALAVRCQAAVVIDHALQEQYLVVETDHPEPAALLHLMQKDISGLQKTNLVEQQEKNRLNTITFKEESDADFFHSVARIKEYIRAGDVFQVNLSREWRVECAFKPSATALYSALRKANPAPFAGLFEWTSDSGTRHAVVSSSPERLVSVRGSQVQTRPIAGTRARQAQTTGNNSTDQSELESLLLHPKERAEHIMLIDLERNDLGRVCEPGSIEVNELLGVESYTHVHHIVSNVRGKLKSDCTAVDALRAVFPGGTITGCPKVHCMEIIAELERCSRGPYTGAMGYLDRCGNLDMNILIRSLELDGKQIRFRAGAGIVADSDPQSELEETRAKAQGLLKALDLII